MEIIANLCADILSITLWVSIIICAALLLRRFASKRISPLFFKAVWLVLALRLALPFSIQLVQTPVKVEIPAVVQTQESVSAAPHYSIAVPAAPSPAPQAAQVQTPAQSGLDITALVRALPYIWLLGAALFLASRLIPYLVFRVKLSRTRSRANADVQSLAKEIFGKSIDVYIADVNSPMLVGAVHSAVYLPLETGTEQLKYVLAHEARHYINKDIIYLYIMLAAQAVHWFNPLVHMMSAAARGDIELVCDAAVLSGKSTAYRQSYGSAVLASVTGKRTQPLTTCLGGGVKQLKRRFIAMFDTAKKRRFIPLTVIIALTAIIAGSLVSCGVKQQGAADAQNMSYTSSDNTPADETPFWENALVIGDGQTIDLFESELASQSGIEKCFYESATAQEIVDNKKVLNDISFPVTLADLDAKLEKAHRVVVIFGNNSLAQTNSGRETAADTEKLLDYLLKSKKSDLITVCALPTAVLPSSAQTTYTQQHSADYYNHNITQYNTALQQLCADKGIAFIEFPFVLTNDDGSLKVESADENGYKLTQAALAIWKSVIEGGSANAQYTADEYDKFMWPIPGYYTISTGVSNQHRGIDIPAPKGTPVYAAAGGSVVEDTDEGADSYGIEVLVQTGENARMRYAHLSATAEYITVGQMVAQGDLIGYVGSTGASSGNHLHFEYDVNDVPQDPLEHISDAMKDIVNGDTTEYTNTLGFERTDSFEATGTWELHNVIRFRLDTKAGTLTILDVVTGEETAAAQKYRYDPATGEFSSGGKSTVHAVGDGIYTCTYEFGEDILIGKAGARLEDGGEWVSLSSTDTGAMIFANDGKTLTYTFDDIGTRKYSYAPEQNELTVHGINDVVTDVYHFNTVNGVILATRKETARKTEVAFIPSM